jgi:hypothetical protein
VAAEVKGLSKSYKETNINRFCGPIADEMRTALMQSAAAKLAIREAVGLSLLVGRILAAVHPDCR